MVAMVELDRLRDGLELAASVGRSHPKHWDDHGRGAERQQSANPDANGRIGPGAEERGHDLRKGRLHGQA
jgi:hypothetical protein